jgi:hypothetical protein
MHVIIFPRAHPRFIPDTPSFILYLGFPTLIREISPIITNKSNSLKITFIEKRKELSYNKRRKNTKAFVFNLW